MISTNGGKTKIMMLIMFLLLSCVLITTAVWAEDSGDGSGGGRSVPLGLDYSAPVDGARDVSLTGDIKLTFNKNVIYLSIREENKTCFSLIERGGAKIPIEVIMADDQTPEGHEKRRDITIRPLEKLKPGIEYTVKVSPELQAKNGTSLGHEVKLSFVTAGVAVTEKNEPIPPKNDLPVGTVAVLPGEDNNANKEVGVPAPAVTKEETVKLASGESTATVAEKNPTAGIKDENEGEHNQAAEKDSLDADKTEVGGEPLSSDKQQREQKSGSLVAIVAGLVAVAGYIVLRKRG